MARLGNLRANNLAADMADDPCSHAVSDGVVSPIGPFLTLQAIVIVACVHAHVHVTCACACTCNMYVHVHVNMYVQQAHNKPRVRDKIITTGGLNAPALPPPSSSPPYK